MPVVKADLGACEGYANCVVAADDVFDIDDDGVVVLLRSEIPSPTGTVSPTPRAAAR